MSEKKKQPKPARRPYQRPQVHRVPVSSEEALLAVCPLNAGGGTQGFEGAPCSACFTAS
ncbi:MAG: hypothetical protein ABIJ09_18895 [Pseudomonadota bacterium]